MSLHICLGQEENHVATFLSFGSTNTPTLVTATLNIAAAILVWRKLDNINPVSPKSNKNERCDCPLTGHFVLIISNFLSLFCISAFEVLVVPVLGQRFDFGQAQSGAIIYGIGSCVLLAAFTFQYLLRCLKIHHVTLVGLLLLAFGCVISLDFNMLYDGCNLWEFNCPRNETEVANITSFDTVDHYPLSIPVQITLEVIATVFCSIGFTWAFISYSGIFVELAVHHEQGRLLPKVGLFMSYMAIGGSCARFFGPLTLAYGLKLSPNLILFGIISLMILNIVMWVGCMKQNLVPKVRRPPPQKESGPVN